MEMLVSVVLIVLITLFMYGAIAGSRMTSVTLSSHAERENNRTLLYGLFYRDIMESLWIKPIPTNNRRFTLLQLQTRNSLYDIAAAHVLWYVRNEGRELVRLESTHAINLPVSYEQKVFIHADVMAREVTDFNIYAGVGAEQNRTAPVVEGNGSREINSTTLSAPSSHYLLYLNAPALADMLMEIAL